ncbi:MAG: hypothetical protein CL678_10620 [Bdellovibrionaceae bacterium]|nr:hypothetical protein [Pseudobdellovibrionaceae bacterium]|tara:strand:+ start:1375 stop:1563 length:189 start_codon:yes stop_codon:yes gene_type:complete
MNDTNKKQKINDGYQPEYYVMTPGLWVRFMRTFWPWQILRFIAINFKMVRMIGKSHGNKNNH